MVKDVTPDELENAIAVSKILFVDCWAPWCGPCLALAPILEELEQKYIDNDDVKFFKVNTQDHRIFAADNDIRAIPCVLVYNDGRPAEFELIDPYSGEPKVVDRLIGLRPPEQYEKVIKQLLS